MTPARIRSIAKQHGISHAEDVLHDVESQIGKEKCADARAAWEKMARELYDQSAEK